MPWKPHPNVWKNCVGLLLGWVWVDWWPAVISYQKCRALASPFHRGDNYKSLWILIGPLPKSNVKKWGMTVNPIDLETLNEKKSWKMKLETDTKVFLSIPDWLTHTGVTKLTSLRSGHLISSAWITETEN